MFTRDQHHPFGQQTLLGHPTRLNCNPVSDYWPTVLGIQQARADSNQERFHILIRHQRQLLWFNVYFH